jgi:hypothetical protein
LDDGSVHYNLIRAAAYSSHLFIFVPETRSSSGMSWLTTIHTRDWIPCRIFDMQLSLAHSLKGLKTYAFCNHPDL